jgi:RNA polymerase sigma-70 factor (ECF subfamily)
MVIRIAYQNLKNQADAEDVTQEVFIKLLKQPAFNDDNHLKAWLIRITINQCKDLMKSDWFRKRQPLDENWQPHSEKQLGIISEIWKLPKNYRNVIYLYYYENYSVPEIARILGENENTISSRLTRARKKLKIILIEEGVRT